VAALQHPPFKNDVAAFSLEPSLPRGVSAAIRELVSMSHTDSEHWRGRAGEALAQAVNARDEWARWTLLQIAVGYDHLAKRAEEESIEPMSENFEG
jgi:hypothetical protein